MSKPIISVIIPTCDRNELLSKCLDRLAPGHQTLDSSKYEVIVSDDGLRGTAEEMISLKYGWARWTGGPGKGPAANRNNGAKLARGEWLAFTDDDCLPDNNWLSALSQAISPEDIALEGRILPLGDFEKDMAQCPVNDQGGQFWSANIAVKHKVFESVEGFDENYRLAAHEDQDLFLRLSPLQPVKFVPEAVIWHPVKNTSLWKRLSKLPAELKNYSYHLKKHGSPSGEKGIGLIMRDVLLFQLRVGVQHLRKGRFRGAVLTLATLLAALVALPYYYARTATAVPIGYSRS